MATSIAGAGSKSVPTPAPIRQGSPQTFYLKDGSRALAPAVSDNLQAGNLRRQNTAPEPGSSSNSNGNGGPVNNSLLVPGRRCTDNGGSTNPHSRSASKNRKASSPKMCVKCDQVLQGQFVRALGGLWHLNCFTCRDCGKLVAQKFFPHDDEENRGKQYPLCETDYFARLDMICANCGNALRGSYVTANSKKFHLEHFSCAECDLVFSETDSYYEHESNVYCHYHYSTKFAAKCQGCQHSILKQFIELFKNGVNQHWHPQCYMIHKFWTVRLWPQDTAPAKRESISGTIDKSLRDQVWQECEEIERKVNFIWVSLSMYEEHSATRISDMLLQVSNGTYQDTINSARYFIVHCETLFDGCAEVQNFCAMTDPPIEFSFQRETKILCKRLVQFFHALSDLAQTGSAPGVSPELLSIVTNLAHYLKVLIRICLQGALRYEHLTGSDEALKRLIGQVNGLDQRLRDCREPRQDELNFLVDNSSDKCRSCGENLGDEAITSNGKAPMMLLHPDCLTCSVHNVRISAQEALWHGPSSTIVCTTCAQQNSSYYNDAVLGFRQSTVLQHFSHLLRVAHARLHTQFLQFRQPGTELSNNAHSANTSQHAVKSEQAMAADNQAASIRRSLTNIAHRRSSLLQTRPAANGPGKTFKDSQIVNPTPGVFVHSGSPQTQHWQSPGATITLVDRGQENGGQFGSSLISGGPVLDDFSRILAQQQARDMLPNAAAYAGANLVSPVEKAKLVSGHSRSVSGPIPKAPSDNPKRFLSQQSDQELSIIRMIAVSMLSNVFSDFPKDTLVMLVENRKNFWNRFYPFGKNERKDTNPAVSKKEKQKIIFGKELTALVMQDGTDSLDAVGPVAVRVPAILQDLISAMRNMNMALEGVFRKNGSIRQQREMVEKIDKDGTDSIDFTRETPIQVAALLKKFLRDLPDPVLCSRYFKLWLKALSINDPNLQKRTLHLICCLLPKPHRDTLEVLLCFLNWVASFHNVDEESGSKMDTHNLATVIAPNILFDRFNSKTDLDPASNLQAVEVVYRLLMYNDDFAEVPEDIQAIMSDPEMFGNLKQDIPSKEIFRKVAEYSGKKPAPPNSNAPDTNNQLGINVRPAAAVPENWAPAPPTGLPRPGAGIRTFSEV